jgi:hypothetical protein
MAASVTAETPMETTSLDKLFGLDSPELLVLAKEVVELHKKLMSTRDLSRSSFGADQRASELIALRAKTRVLRSLATNFLSYKLEMIIVDCE